MLNVVITDCENFTPDERATLDEAVLLLDKVLNSPEFKERVLNPRIVIPYTTGHLWWKKTVYQTYDTYSENQGKTPSEIYNQILTETHNGVVEMEVKLVMYYDNSRVIGYTYLDTFKTWMNRKFFSQWRETPWNIAGNIIHEHMHTLQYTHLTQPWATSVPYAMGNIVAELGEKLRG